MKNYNRKFSGIWIPRWLYQSKEFTWVEKILILEIGSLDKGDGCYASNQYLAEFLDSSPGHIANTISKLRKLGHVEDIESKEGKRRIKLSDELKSRLGDNETTEESTTKDISFMGAKLPFNEELPTITDETEISPGADEDKQEFLVHGPKNKESVELVFEFWNQYKGRAPWKSHEKVSYDIAAAINEALKHYSVQEICSAIDNYSKVLFDGKCRWTYAWSLSIFLSVKNGVTKDAPRKWYQFLPDNFVMANYLTDRPTKELADEGEYDVELVNKLIKSYSNMINNKGFIPGQRQKHKFIEASRMAQEFFGRHKIQKENWVHHLMQCLNNVYLEKGEVLYPGHLSSDNTWSILLPQYLIELGVGV